MRLSNLLHRILVHYSRRCGDLALPPGDPEEEPRGARVVLPPICRRIGPCAFQDDPELEWISIPGSVRDIQDFAFWGCGNLKTVLLEEGLETIGESAFAQTWLQQIRLPRSLLYLGEGAFEDTMLETVTIPGSVRNIYADTFRSNLYLRRVCLEEGVQSIANGAFAWCRHLREICIPDSLEVIEPYAFEDSTPIADIRASRRWLREHPQYVRLLKEA